MADLLFLAHRIPYPPDKGDKIRAWNILRHLADRYRVHLGAFVDDPADWERTDGLRAVCADCHLLPLNPVWGRLRSLPGLLRGASLSEGYFRDRRMTRWVRDQAAARRFDLVFAYSSTAAQYILGPEFADTRRIVDFVDVDSDKWRQYAANKSWPASAVYGRESRTLLGFERRVAAAVDTSLLVSPQEAELFRRLAPASAARIDHVTNGVDHLYFDPAEAFPNPFDDGAETLVFTGAMDYWANVDAVVWFATEILPAARAAWPGLRFCIVGANPTAAVRDLAGLPGVSVTGRVADVRPYVAHAVAAVAPLRLARGIQNKVLEAMAMGKAVIATPEAVEGIDARAGDDILVASDAAAFADRLAAVKAADRRRDLGLRARALILDRYCWPATLSRLDRLLAE